MISSVLFYPYHFVPCHFVLEPLTSGVPLFLTCIAHPTLQLSQFSFFATLLRCSNDNNYTDLSLGRDFSFCCFVYSTDKEIHGQQWRHDFSQSTLPRNSVIKADSRLATHFMLSERQWNLQQRVHNQDIIFHFYCNHSYYFTRCTHDALGLLKLWSFVLD